MVKHALAYPIVLFCLGVLGAARASPAAVDVYLVPLESFPEDTAKEIAQALSAELKLTVRSTPALGPIDVQMLPGTRLYDADDMIEKAQPLLAKLPDRGAATYCILLTERDMKSPASEGRFEFSTHDPHYDTTIISVARMREYIEGRPIISAHTMRRLYKMTKRNIGEEHLGWRRSPHAEDLMYSRIMSIDDLDRIGLEHEETARGKPVSGMRSRGPAYAI